MYIEPEHILIGAVILLTLFNIYLYVRVTTLSMHIDLLGGVVFALLDSIQCVNDGQRGLIEVIRPLLKEGNNDLNEVLKCLDNGSAITDELSRRADDQFPEKNI